MNEYVIDSERVNLVRQGADKVLTYMLDYCATSFDDQKAILELALAETNNRIARRDNK
jgi:hypothetical protein